MEFCVDDDDGRLDIIQILLLFIYLLLNSYPNFSIALYIVMDD